MPTKLYVVGTGPGGKEYLLPVAEKKINEAEVLFGAKKVLEMFPEHQGNKYEISGDIDSLRGLIEKQLELGKKVAVLLGGDPCFYSLLKNIRHWFYKYEIEVVPGISSFQLAFCRLAEEWDDAVFTSLHGRPLHRGAFSPGKKQVILTDFNNSPARIAEYLLSLGYPDAEAVVAEELGTCKEKITRTSLKKLAQEQTEFGPCTMIIKDDGRKRILTDTYSLPDEALKKAGVPMTKEEIRAVVIAKARLAADAVVYDVGAGTGSIAIQASRMAFMGRVYAVEKDPEHLGVLKHNVSRWANDNLIIVEGEAPECVKGFESADAIIIGGSGGKFGEILDWALETLKEAGRLVINAVTLETFMKAWARLKDEPRLADVEIVSLTVTRWENVGDFHLPRPLNPVYVIAATKK